MIDRLSHGDITPPEVSALRPRLLGLAYRMLGDVDEAEDIVQEAYLRWQRADQHIIRSPEAWLVTVATRLAVDRLRRLRTERAAYPGPWLPEPVATAPVIPSDGDAPDRGAELASDLSIALLILLERLRPEERAAYLLREVFDTEYEEIARILERSQDAVRQMVHRARTRVRAERPRVASARGEQQRLLERFVAALESDDAAGLLALLAPDVVLTSDGGGRATAIPNQLLGPDRVSRFLLGVARKFYQGVPQRVVHLNGEPAVLNIANGTIFSAVTFDIVDGVIKAVNIVRNPDKLAHALQFTQPIA